MDNTIITPHALCWTDECFADIASTALQSIVDFAQGRRPKHVVNVSRRQQGCAGTEPVRQKLERFPAGRRALELSALPIPEMLHAGFVGLADFAGGAGQERCDLDRADWRISRGRR